MMLEPAIWARENQNTSGPHQFPVISQVPSGTVNGCWQVLHAVFTVLVAKAPSRRARFDMLFFWKYGLYAFLRFALFEEKRSAGERKASTLLLSGKREEAKSKLAED
jgi:hypothetical protein